MVLPLASGMPGIQSTMASWSVHDSSRSLTRLCVSRGASPMHLSHREHRASCPSCLRNLRPIVGPLAPATCTTPRRRSRIGGRMLVDGGMLANLPVSQAIELGATRVYALPAMSNGVGSLPSGAIDIMQRSMMIATAALAQRDLDEARGCAEVFVLPVPTAAQLSMFDFGETPVLMEGAYLAAAAWLRENES